MKNDVIYKRPSLIERKATMADQTYTQIVQEARRVGKAAVAEFFTTLSKSLAFSRFEPREYIAQDDKVVALGHYEGTALPTGRTVNSDWVMVFTLRNGKVIQFREYADSAGVNAAYQP